MAQDSTVLSRIPVNPIGKGALAMLVFAGGLEIAPAAAHDPVALIETLTSPTQRVELMSYARFGEIIRLSHNQTMVLIPLP